MKLEIRDNSQTEMLGNRVGFLIGGISLIAKAVVLKTTSNRASGVWVEVPLPPQNIKKESNA